jgi:hypothetical protein
LIGEFEGHLNAFFFVDKNLIREINNEQSLQGGLKSCIFVALNIGADWF